MNAPTGKEDVLRRVVVEYGRWYVYTYITDGNGRLIDEECFKQPFQLSQREAAEEANDCYQQTYQWLQDTVLWYSTARDDGESSDSGKTPEK